MKKLICILLCFVMLLGVVACGQKDDGGKVFPDVENGQQNNQGDVSQDNESAEPNVSVPGTVEDDQESGGDDEVTDSTNDQEVNEYREGSAEYVAQQFIQTMIDGKYEETVRHFAVPEETPFFTATDIEWYLPRSNYADVQNITFANYAIVVEKTGSNTEAACEVTVQDKDSDKSVKFELKLVLDQNNKWGVKDNSFYLDEYYVVAPGGDAILTVDGVDASDYQDGKFGKTQYQYLYKLTFIGKSEKVFAVSAETFETDEEKVYPIENNSEEPLKLVVEYEDQGALDALSSIWNEFYQAVLNDKSYSEMINLLSPSADPAIAQAAMNGIQIMTEEGKCYDFMITKMWYAAQKEGTQTKWLASDKLQVCFNYNLNWTYDPGYWGPASESMTNCDVIVLHFDGENFMIDTPSTNNTFFTVRQNKGNSTM